VELQAQDPSNQESQKNLVLAGLIDGDAHAATGSIEPATTIWNETLQLLDTIPFADRNPELMELPVALLVRLGRDELARANKDELSAMGYQSRFINLPEVTTASSN